MKKTAGIIAAPIVAAILLFAAFSSCSGSFVDPGTADMDRGGMSGGGGGSISGGGGSGGGGGEVPPELKPVKDRWGKWIAPDATATLNYSVANDGVCTITIGGTPQPNNQTDGWGRWKANAQYYYTAKAGKSYTYKFEAWTESGNRVVNFQYCYVEAKGIYFEEEISLTTKRQTFTVNGKPIAEGSLNQVDFQGADQLGKYYVKILEIKEVGSSGNSNTGILTFSDGVPNFEDVFIIDNKTDTSKPDWRSAKIVAHYNTSFKDQDVTYTTLRLRVPKRSLTVSNSSDISSDDKVWTGGGTYTIYVSYFDYSSWPFILVEKKLKGVKFTNGCATVKWSDFTNLDESGGGNNTGDITYTATANSTTNTTAIDFNFGEAVSGLKESDITITKGTGTVTKGALTGSGTSWSLGITVATAGTVTVKITKSGIDSGTKTVTVSKGSDGGSSPFNGTWINESDSSDIITINNPNWTRTKGYDKSGTLNYTSAESPDKPNIRDNSGSNIGAAKIVSGKLQWDIGWQGAVIFSKGSGGGTGSGGGSSTMTWTAVTDSTFSDDYYDYYPIRAIAYGNGTFVAVGSGKIMYSSGN